MTRIVWTTSFALALLATPAFAQAPEPAKPIDVERFYTGTWHEIGRRPMRITDGCVAGATHYAPGRTAGEIAVRDTCQVGSPSGRTKSISGVGRIVDAGTSAKLKVRYRFGLLPITREYWVLDRAADYSWFISADPDFKDLYIFTRDARISAAERDRLVERARGLGYDVSRLEFPAQP